MSERTFTAEQIERAVLSYHEGCTPGKISFLSEAFGIETTCERRVIVTMTVIVPRYDDDGDEIETDRIDGEIQDLIDRNLADHLACHNGATIDCRVSTVTNDDTYHG